MIKSIKRKILIAPSILSADFSNLANDVRMVEKGGADWLHIDVMDGHFVPNLTIGPEVVRCIRKRSRLFFDVHLMIDRPDLYWQSFADAGANLITFHAEAKVSALGLISKIQKAGLKAGISLRPKTALTKNFFALLPYVDLVLIMTVEPGFGGQKFMRGMLARIREIRSFIDNQNLHCYVQVDGGINTITGREAVHAGADVLVAGSSIFKDKNPRSAARNLRKMAKKNR